MKKIIFLFFISFLCVMGVRANTFYLGEKVPNMYVESIDGSNFHNGAPFLLHRNDGAIVYCINPFKMMSTTGTYKAYTYNDPIFNLNNTELNKMNIIAYYGYGYKGHTDIKWYGITQYYLWKSLFENAYFTDVYQGTKVEKYTSEVKELETLVFNYYKLPSFSNKKYEYNPNAKYEIIDTNNILNNYQISESNIDASISNNKLIVNTKNSGIYTIKFIRKSPVTRNYILYGLDGAQELLYPGKINDITFTLTIEVNSGSIAVNKFDSDNKNRLEATLSDSIYGIYKDNILVDKLVTNDNGSANISNLPLGSYTVKEITPSKGYKIDTNTYNVTISKNNKDIFINSYSKVIEGNLIINKYYGSKNDYKLDESATFEIYHHDKLISTLKGEIKEKFEYGTYTVKQVSGKKYYDLVENFDVSILKEEDYIYNLYTDKTDEIKAYEELLQKKEESLNKKENELIELEKKLEETKKKLEELKNEINKNAYDLDNKKEEVNKLIEELNKKQEELNKLEEDLNSDKKEIENKKEQINKLIEEINQKEKELNKLEKELEDSKKKLNKREQELIKLENNLSTKTTNTKKDVLVVEAPNTYKKDNKKILSKLLIVIGTLFIFLGIKKTTIIDD